MTLNWLEYDLLYGCNLENNIFLGSSPNAGADASSSPFVTFPLTIPPNKG